MSDSVVENLILAIEAMGMPEAVAAVDSLTVAVDDLAVSLDRADVAAGGGRAKKGGLFSALTSMKALFATLMVGAAITSFANFSSQMERLRTQTGATQKEVASMSKGVLDMAVSVGTGPQSLAQALYHIESAGFRGKEALNALKIAAQGAKIGGAELTMTTTGLTAVLVAGFKGVDTLQKAMGALNATVGAGDMTFEDLNNALGTGILATFKAAGLQVNDLGASLAVLGDNNIRGAKAATQMRQAVLGMLGPSKQAQGVLAELGMQPLQMAEDLRKPNGLLVALTDLKSHLDKLAPTQRENAVVQIFGRRESGPILTLLEQLDRLKQKYVAVNKGQKDFNADWAATKRQIGFVLDQLKVLGEVALIKLSGGIAWVVEKVKGFIEALEHGKIWAVALAGGIVGLAVAMGAGTAVTAAYAAAWWALGAAIAVVDAIPIVALFAAIAVALYLLITHFKDVEKVAVKAWHWIEKAGADALHWIEKAASDVFNWIKDHWQLLAGILFGPFVLAGAEIVTHWKEILHFLEGVASKIAGVAATIGKGIWEGIKWGIDKVIEGFEYMIHSIGLPGIKVGPIKWGGFHPFSGVHLPRMEMGGDVNASGSYLVGEKGPEIVYLERGNYVQPNHEIKASTGGQSQDERPIENIIVLDGRVLSRSVVRQGLMAQSTR